MSGLSECDEFQLFKVLELEHFKKVELENQDLKLYVKRLESLLGMRKDDIARCHICKRYDEEFKENEATHCCIWNYNEHTCSECWSKKDEIKCSIDDDECYGMCNNCVKYCSTCNKPYCYSCVIHRVHEFNNCK